MKQQGEAKEVTGRKGWKNRGGGVNGARTIDRAFAGKKMRYSDFPRYSWLESGAPAAPDYKISRKRLETLEYSVIYRIKFLFFKVTETWKVSRHYSGIAYSVEGQISNG